MSDKQHYVPQFLLRPFGHGSKKSRKLHAFDKKSRVSEYIAIKDIAYEDHLYDLSDGSKSLDPLLSELEQRTAPLIKNIVEKRSVRLISKTEKFDLSFFFVVQMMRTIQSFRDFESTQKKFKATLKGMGIDEESELGHYLNGNSTDDYINIIATTAPKLAGELFRKAWILYTPKGANEFITSDNPVVKYNMFEAPPFQSNLGLSCEGIEINIPLAPDLLLSLMCEKTTSPVALNELTFAQYFIDGKPIPIEEIFLRHYNSLQVIHSERFIFSSSKDFGLPADMLDTNPELVEGPRSKLIHPLADSYSEEEVERAKNFDPTKPQQLFKGRDWEEMRRESNQFTDTVIPWNE